MASTFPETSLSTERLVLRPFDEEDVPALVDMMNDEPIRTWTSVPAPYTEYHALQWVNGQAPAERTEGRGIVFAVSEFLTHRLVGMLHLHHTDWRHRTTEVSYVTASWARGEGYAAEAALAAAEWAFHDQGIKRMELRTAAGNTASQQVAQKIGCISEGVLRSAWTLRAPQNELSDRELRTDLIVWSLLPEDLEGTTLLSGSGAGQGQSWL
ncbi:acetyltransferase [Wenjunlia vitaminophila]|uniref:Acetyltransferase n=1 Tax=Wenjunlia vitaminophila TaxID=76728 RepID=A0A0T6LW18_WENVI|nr:GNAT family protein [Wenjunlia vitaminophila]KRV50318.1 acetyltransferase [Wenjunlia vitaminophila]